MDELLQVDKLRIEETIQKYQEQSLQFRQKGEWRKDIALWEEAYAQFPNDCRVLSRFMHALSMNPAHPRPMEDSKRIIQFGEEILKKSNDEQLRSSAIQGLCFAYNEIGDKEKALFYANMGGSFYVTANTLRAHILKGEEGIEATQSYLKDLIHAAAQEAVSLTTKADYPPEEELEMIRFSINLLLMLFSDGNVGFHAIDLSRRYFYLARIYARLQEETNTLKELERCVYYAVTYDTLPDETKYTALMANRLRFYKSKVVSNHSGNECDCILSYLENPCFAFVCEKEEFQALKAKLKQYAKVTVHG